MTVTTTATTASPSRTYTSLRAAWIPLAALCLAFFVEMVDNTLLSIALPTIGRDLGSGTTGLQWVTGAYSLTFGGLLLTAGSIADRFGRRRVLLAGLAVFGLLSLCVIAVTTAGELIALRAALGLAAAAMAPITNSLVFRLFDDTALRMRAVTVMIVVGMSGFVLGPLLGGTALAHVRWEWLLVVNAPIALIACIGVRLGVPVDRPEDLTNDALDLPGAALSISTIGLACWSLTSGVLHGWVSAITIISMIGAVVAGVAFVWHERRTAAPMLDLDLFSTGTVRGAAIAQVGTSIAMASVMFGLILHFQYAYGWSPMKAGLANLPIIVTMLAAAPFSEWLVRRYGHRIACLVGAIFLGGSLLGLAWAVDHGYARHRRLHGPDDRRTAHRHDDLCGGPRRCDAEQPHLHRRRAQRHRPGGRHQRRYRGDRHHDRRAGHHAAPRRHVEQRPRRIVLPRRADHLRRARASSSASSPRSARSRSPTRAPPTNTPDRSGLDLEPACRQG